MVWGATKIENTMVWGIVEGICPPPFPLATSSDERHKLMSLDAGIASSQNSSYFSLSTQNCIEALTVAPPST